MKVKELERLLPNDTLMIIEKHNFKHNSKLILRMVGSLKPNPAAEEEVYMIHPIDKNGIGILLKSTYI